MMTAFAQTLAALLTTFTLAIPACDHDQPRTSSPSSSPAGSTHGSPVASSAAPADFTIEFEIGPRAADEAPAQWRRVEPDGKGGFVYLEGEQDRAGRRETARRSIDVAVVAALASKVTSVRFFALAADYEDPHVFDGSVSSITVRMNGRTKTVQVANADVAAYDEVAAALYDASKLAR
jgi:hypothetical protein